MPLDHIKYYEDFADSKSADMDRLWHLLRRGCRRNKTILKTHFKRNLTNKKQGVLLAVFSATQVSSKGLSRNDVIGAH